MSEEAACVISGMLPIDILAEERRMAYHEVKVNKNSAAEVKSDLRLKSLRTWQERWDTSEKERWTHRLIPQIEDWLNRGHGEVNYYLTQMLSGHGCFRSYLYKYKHEDSPICPTCDNANEDAEHVFFVCPRFSTARNRWNTLLGTRISPENLTQMMLGSEEAWEETCSYATGVLKNLRREEQ